MIEQEVMDILNECVHHKRMSANLASSHSLTPSVVEFRARVKAGDQQAAITELQSIVQQAALHGWDGMSKRICGVASATLDRIDEWRKAQANAVLAQGS